MTAVGNDHDICRIGSGLLDRTLPKSQWTHQAHFAAAICLLRYSPELTAPAEIGRVIRAYNEATATPNTDSSGYHHTITMASIRAASAYLGRCPNNTLHHVLNDMMASDLGRSDWLLAYWSPGRLFDVQARRSWVDPDLKAFPY